MKKLNIYKMQTLQGGGAKEIADAICFGAGAAGLVLTIAKVSLGPIGTGVAIGCSALGIWEGGKGLGFW